MNEHKVENGKNDDAPGHNKSYEIIINGETITFTKDEISFEEVVKYAFPDRAGDPDANFTVTYDKGHGNSPDGMMVSGDTVKVKKSMEFYVTDAGVS